MAYGAPRGTVLDEDSRIEAELPHRPPELADSLSEIQEMERGMPGSQ